MVSEPRWLAGAHCVSLAGEARDDSQVGAAGDGRLRVQSWLQENCPTVIPARSDRPVRSQHCSVSRDCNIIIPNVPCTDCLVLISLSIYSSIEYSVTLIVNNIQSKVLFYHETLCDRNLFNVFIIYLFYFVLENFSRF